MRPMKMHVKDPQPPNPPWKPLTANRESRSFIEYYYSDSATKVPIRDVSHPVDPKADPNLETMTYGLFSKCNRRMRKSIAEKGITTIFFCTNRKGSIRILTGYYRIGWSYEVEPGDYMLKASEMRFVNPGFPLTGLRDYLGGYPIDGFFRTSKYVEEPHASHLLKLLKATPDATPSYLSEIRRLSQPPLYTWEAATRPMKL